MSTDMDLPEPIGYATANGLRMLRQDDATVLLYRHDYLIRPDATALFTAHQMRAVIAERDALRAQVEALRVALKPFADADLTLPTVRDTFGFDVLRARAALDTSRAGGGK